MTLPNPLNNNMYQAPASFNELERRLPGLITSMAALVRSPVDPAQIHRALMRDESFTNLCRGWDMMDRLAQARAWQMVLDRTRQAAVDSRPFCVRCGECCRRGSPALYNQDRLSLSSGAITRSDLVTLRRGEIVYSNKEGKLAALTEERVKLKEAPGTRTCIFLGPGGDACLIYPDRPWQCQVMECWDSSRFETLLTMPALTRTDLLGPDTPLTPILLAHEQKTDLADFRAALNRIADDDLSSQDDAREMILYDLHVREFMNEKFNLPADEMDFFLGRPLAVIRGEYGFSLEQDDAGLIRLVRAEPQPDEGQPLENGRMKGEGK